VVIPMVEYLFRWEYKTVFIHGKTPPSFLGQ
jgi:hypothetical protein